MRSTEHSVYQRQMYYLKYKDRDVNLRTGKERNFIRDRRGFTVVELVVVIVIIAIVAGLAVTGILAWRDWADFISENEYAETLFVAAQNQLNDYSADSRLDAMQMVLLGDNKDDSSKELTAADRAYDVTYSVGTNLNLTDIGYSEDELNDIWNRDSNTYRDRILSIRAKKGQYSDYENGTLTETDEAYWVYTLLSSYVYDTGILNDAAICIEFTPADGQVFSVFYSDKNSEYTYVDLPGEVSESDTAYDIRKPNREEKMRQKRKVGYYDVDSLSKAISVGSDRKPEINKVRLYNKETLYMTFRIGKYPAAYNQMTYSIDLLDADRKNASELRIVIDGRQIKNKATVLSDPEENMVDCKVIRYDTVRIDDYGTPGNSVWVRAVESNCTAIQDGIIVSEDMPILVWSENSEGLLGNDPMIHVVLDQADLRATAYGYEKYHDSIIDYYKGGRLDVTEALITQIQPYDSIMRTQSFFRFGLKPDNVYVEVKATSSTYGNTKAANNTMAQKPKNTCFAGSRPGETVNAETKSLDSSPVYTVTNARHLNNIRYLEALEYEDQDLVLSTVSGTKTAALNTDSASVSKIVYKVGKDIAWDTVNTDEADMPKRDVTKDYPSIERIRMNDSLDGGNNTISGMNISYETNKGEYYSYCYTDDTGNMNFLNVEPTGFINNNYGSVTDLTLDNITVSGGDYTGGFFGVNACYARNLTLTDTCSVEGRKYVGGIAGIVLPSGNGKLSGVSVYSMKDEQNKILEAEVMESITNEGTVTGALAVGGITGAVRNDISFVKDLYLLASDEELSNEFAGLTEAEDASVTPFIIRNSANYGNVSLTTRSISDDPLSTINGDSVGYAGGIAGYVYDRSYKDPSDTTAIAHIIINDCEGSLSYDESTASAVVGTLNDTTAYDEFVNSGAKGNYVGGIAGYNYGGQISRCSTTDHEDSSGYVIGKNHVGGIVGLNYGYLGGNVYASNIDRNLSKGVNTSKVVGVNYVGGVAGCNSDYALLDGNEAVELISYDPEKIEETTFKIVPVNDPVPENVIGGFVNRATVVAAVNCGGGVTGYNTGTLENNNSIVNFNNGDLALYQLAHGDHIGGIAGYNGGILTNDQTANTQCYIVGHSYLGGVVGYNDANTRVEEYTVASGAVYGDEGSCCVGGYAGFNASVSMLMDEEGNPRDMITNANVINGSYLVGGNIGANIINTEDNEAGYSYPLTIQASFKPNGFFKQVIAREFAGGYIGYNLMISNELEDLTANPNYTNASMYVIRNITDRLEAMEYSEAAPETSLHTAKGMLDGIADPTDELNHIAGINPDPDNIRLTIVGQTRSYIRSGTSKISAGIFAGGVIGYNDNDTYLYIKNIENATPVTATCAIAYADDDIRNEMLINNTLYNRDYAGETAERTYAYVGGIIGRAGKNATLDNCSNATQGLITSDGTYQCGLCEVNEGRVVNCTVANLGDGTHDYVGGLCGLNKGRIESCIIDGRTISGKNVVGGLVAENYGILRNNSINETHVRAYGTSDGVAGTYAGLNGETGNIELDDSMENIDVISTGRYVGGITGVNKGLFKNVKIGFKEGYSDSDLATYQKLSGMVRGKSVVGGLVGWNDIDTSGMTEEKAEEYTLKGFDNYASIIADNGTAGGIVGRTTGRSTISYCANHGDVSSPLSGNSGGIIASNNGVISYCRDFAAVTAVNGMSGGIAAVNMEDGVLKNIRVEAPSGVEQTITFESKTACGAVTAQNYGAISGIYINGVNVQNVKGYERASVGAVTGQNIFSGDYDEESSDPDSDKYHHGYILLTEADADNIVNCTIIVKSNYSYAGGITGTNTGTITGDSETRRPRISPVIRLEGCDRATIGGVTGTNSELVSNLSVDAEIIGGKGNRNNTIGYGGVAGINTGRIKYCTFDGLLNSYGDAGNPASTGGIAGINREGASVVFCGLGVSTRNNNITHTAEGGWTLITSGDYWNRDFDTNPDMSAYAYLGGIVGLNYGLIRDIDMNGKYDDTLNNHLNTSDYVLIVGFNGTSGGIAGMNYSPGTIGGYVRSDGTVRYLTTCGGGKTEVAMHGSQNDSGAGGIIGIDHTGGNFQYIESYALVQSLYAADVHAGGIIAVCEPEKSNRLVMDHVYYFGNGAEKNAYFEPTKDVKFLRGDVTGYSSAGGLVGLLKYGGFDISSCENYGEVISVYSDAGGFIGMCGMLNSDSSFTSCNNHGYVHLPLQSWDGKKNIRVKSNNVDATLYTESEGHASPGAGGFLACYKETTAKESVYLYDCVNTGIIKRDWETLQDCPEFSKTKNAKPLNEIIGERIGNFVGYGMASDNETERSYYWHFEACRNYNTAQYGAEGFIGLSRSVQGEYFTNCFDAGGTVTKSFYYSPFVTNSVGSHGTEMEMVNSFYINGEQRYYSTDPRGTYFTFAKHTSDLEYDEIHYGQLRGGPLFLSAPDRDSYMCIQDSTGAVELHVTNEAGSPGMSALNMYMCLHKDADGEQYQYAAKATFTDVNGNQATVNAYCTENGTEKEVTRNDPVDVNDDFDKLSGQSIDQNKITFKVPSNLGKIKRILVEAECLRNSGDYPKYIFFRGFTWVPKDTGVETVCTNLEEKNDVSFTISSINKNDYEDDAEIGFWNDSVRSNELNCYYYRSDGIKCYYYDDALAIDWNGSERLYYKKDTGKESKITINVSRGEDPSGISDIVFYPVSRIGSSGSPTRVIYNYYVLLYRDGESPYRYPSSGTIEVNVKDTDKMVSRQQIPVPEEYRDSLSQIDIVVTSSNYVSSGSEYVWLSGFGWIPEGSDTEELMAPSMLQDAQEELAVNTRAMKLYTDYSNSSTAPYVYYCRDKEYGFNMDANDPVNEVYYADRDPYSVSDEKADGTNSRIRVYEDIDPKVMDLIKENYSRPVKLDTPVPVISLENGTLVTRWAPIENAYEYRFKYVITDTDGNIIEQNGPMRLGSQMNSHSVNYRDEWNGKGYTMSVMVQAISGIGGYDSDEGHDSLKISKLVLPQPEVHLELTADNKMVAVLDNRNDYLKNDGSGEYIDCNIEVIYDARGNDPYYFYIPVYSSRFSMECHSVEYDHDGGKSTDIRWIFAKAEPDPGIAGEYSESSMVPLEGHVADNKELVSGDPDYITDYDEDEDRYEYRPHYRGQTYIPYMYKKRLRGFRNADVDHPDVEHIEYVIQYKQIEERDAYMRTDISEYDERLGMWVAVATGEEEIGSDLRRSEKISTLTGLPKEWFSGENPTEILVRNYLSRSENEIVHYGHDVASGISLDMDTPEANRAVISAYTDPYTVTSDDEGNTVISEDVSVWDPAANNGEGGLKPGYVLVRDKNDEEDAPVTYSIYYNATLKLAKENAETVKGSGTVDRYSNDYEYYLYDVVYKVYDTTVNDTLIEYEDTDETETVSTNGIRALDHREITLENGHVVGTNYNESYRFTRTNDKYSDRVYQDTSPVPILAGPVKQGRDQDGNTTFTVRWDEFYRNEKTWNYNKLDPEDPETAATLAGYQYYNAHHGEPDKNKEDYYVANTWTAFTNKTGYYDVTDRDKRKDMMNAYYLTYSHNASYTVEFIGITEDGQEVVLGDPIKVTSAQAVPVEDGYTAVTYNFTASNGNNRTAKKYSKWVYSATITREDDWVYSDYKIRITNDGSLYSMLEGITDGSVGGLNYDAPFDDIDSINSDKSLCYYRLPKYMEFDLEYAEPFTLIQMPDVNLITDTSGEGEGEENEDVKSGLNYEVKWAGITDASELNDLGGYLITVKVASSEKTGEWAATHYYYVEEAGDSEIDIDLNLLESQGVVVRIDPEDYFIDGDTRTAIIDMSDFYDGDRVDVSVKALPNKAAVDHYEGDEGIARTVVIPYALSVPDVNKLKVDETRGMPLYDSEEAASVSANLVTAFGDDDDNDGKPVNAVSREVWSRGLFIGYVSVADDDEGIAVSDDTDYSYDPSVNILAAIAVYDEGPAEDEAADRSALPMSGSEWCDGSTDVLYSKDEPLNLGNVDGDPAEVVLSILDDGGEQYAGKWLKIALKAKSENNIDSRWTDQDAEASSINYRWIRLPYILKDNTGTVEEPIQTEPEEEPGQPQGSSGSSVNQGTTGRQSGNGSGGNDIQVEENIPVNEESNNTDNGSPAGDTPSVSANNTGKSVNANGDNNEKDNE